MMISFHLPPTAASAAVSGQSLTGLRRAGRRYAPAGAFLPGEAIATSLSGMRMNLLAFGLLATLQVPSPPGPPTPAPRDGQHDFDFEFGTWKTRLSRRLRPLTGSTTWVEYQGTTVVRKVWDGRANLVELEVDGPPGHLEG